MAGTAVGLLFADDSTITAASTKKITINDVYQIIPEANNTANYDLGSTSFSWDKVYTDEICFDGASDCMTTSAVSSSQYWSAASGALFPSNVTQDVLFGNIATSSARVRIGSSLYGGLASLIVNQPESQDIFTASAGGSPKFTINSGGDIGIGTTTPQANIDIYDATPTILLRHDTSDISDLVGITATGPLTTNRIAQVMFEGTSGYGGNIRMQTSNEGAAYVTRMTVLEAGGVNINLAGTSVDLLQLNHSDSFSTNDEGQLNFTQGSASLSRISNYYSGSDFGLKFYTYTGSLNSTPVLTLTGANKVGIGTTTPTALLTVDNTSISSLGKAVAIFNQDESQDILTASAAGTTRLRLANNGDLALTSTETSGNVLDLDMDFLTTGIGINAQSLSNNLSSGNLGLFDWSPTTWATASGDLVKINLGQYGDTTGNLFAIYDNGSELFSVDTAKITSSIPHEFTAAGDVSVAYDINFTNQTSSQIESSGPFTLRVGEAFENNNLTLKTYGTGNVIFDQGTSGKVLIGTGSASMKFTVSDSQSATAAAMIENFYNGPDADGLIIKLGYTGLNTATNSFINFMNASGDIHGSIKGTAGGTTINYQSSGVDMAEYFVKDSSQFAVGDIVSQSELGATKTATGNDPKMLGVVSDNPGFSGGTEGPNKILVGIVGQVPVRVSPSSTAIQPGDLITGSTDPGKAVKAQKPGYVIGKAMETWDPAHPKDKINIFLTNSWADPNQSLAFDNNGNLSIKGNIQATDFVIDASLDQRISILETQVASASAQLAQLTTLTSPQPSPESGEGGLPGEVWEYATASGKLITAFPVQVPELVVTGQLSVGILQLDDMEGDISSLTGLLSLQNGAATLDDHGNFTVTGTLIAKTIQTEKLNILGASIGTAILPAGLTELSVDTTAVSTGSSILVTPVATPVPVAAVATKSGQFIVRIPTALAEDLKVNWWVIN